MIVLAYAETRFSADANEILDSLMPRPSVDVHQLPETGISPQGGFYSAVGDICRTNDAAQKVYAPGPDSCTSDMFAGRGCLSLGSFSALGGTR